ncbi:hypothetical protein J2S09_000918 [Bacillus fengqiuensis]|nr:hypothetical protein [Bacillus fengqiuensis]
MNNFRWMTRFFNTKRSRQLLNMFGRRRNNRGVMWASLLGIGASAAAYGLGRNRGNNGMGSAIQNAVKNSGLNNLQRVVPMPNKRAYAEFAEEMSPNQNQSPIEDVNQSNFD